MSEKGRTFRDPRIAEIFRVIQDLASGNMEARGTPSQLGDDLDRILVGLNMLAEEFYDRHNERQDYKGRLEKLQHVIMALARLDFSQKALLGDAEDELSAVAAGLNMLSEELRDSTVSKDFLDSIMESMIDPLIVVNPDGTIRTVNSATNNLLGYETGDLVGQQVDILFKEEEEELRFRSVHLKKVVENQTLRDLQAIFRAKDGSLIPIVINSSCIPAQEGGIAAVVCVGRDMRETKRLLAAEAAADAQRERAEELVAAYRELKATQSQLVQVGKLAGLGELSAGIAHELNQPITSIRGFIQLLRSEIRSLDSQQTDMIERILKATDRMSRIIDNLRVFARHSNFKSKPTPPSAPFDDALELVSEQLRLHEINVEKDIERNLPKVMAESIQLQQVFLNLLANARYALDCIEQGRAKRLLLSVRKDGQYVTYVVEDNGPGVAEEHENQLLDPFFTTKPPGEGMGLGLSLSYGIVKDHGGEITFERVPSGGARFIVRIPIAQSHDLNLESVIAIP